MFLYFCLWLFKSLSQMAFYFSNLILQTAIFRNTRSFMIKISEFDIIVYKCLLRLLLIALKSLFFIVLSDKTTIPINNTSITEGK